MPSEQSQDPWHRLHGIDDTVVRRPARSSGGADTDDTVLRTSRHEVGPTSREPSGPGRPAPRLHGVRVAGQDLLLDAPVVVGRRPAGPRVASGPVPRLVTVPSPRHEVSGAHVDVRQQGDIVVVTDLRSTNGTRVIEPGRVPVILRQGESLVARAGTIVDVGDGNLLEILPPQRIIPTKEPLL
ncbi:FHA domain-containing protein [Frigoribacterium sp. PhB24]|uniref:FHA domain-containing protein n=1 Tax=Frigoribacterium sp. PhB24 TaxID=2485204 RepID=UPI000F4623D9|nr:hypothetical protein EDF50_0732 [Frigoribacterium sp. PhB24]